MPVGRRRGRTYRSSFGNGYSWSMKGYWFWECEWGAESSFPHLPLLVPSLHNNFRRIMNWWSQSFLHDASFGATVIEQEIWGWYRLDPSSIWWIQTIDAPRLWTSRYNESCLMKKLSMIRAGVKRGSRGPNKGQWVRVHSITHKNGEGEEGVRHPLLISSKFPIKGLECGTRSSCPFLPPTPSSVSIPNLMARRVGGGIGEKAQASPP